MPCILKSENDLRNDREAGIARKCVRVLLAHGYTVSVCDGEEVTVKRSTDTKAIFAALGTTDEDILYAHKEGRPVYMMHLVYGNDCDLLSDYSTALDPVCQEIYKWIETRFADHA